MILALITSLALLLDDEREEFNRTGNIVPGVTLISFFAASFSAMPEPTRPVEEAAWSRLREFPGWAALGCVRNVAHRSAPSNGHRNPARPRSAVALLVFIIFFSRFPTVPSLHRPPTQLRCKVEEGGNIRRGAFDNDNHPTSQSGLEHCCKPTNPAGRGKIDDRYRHGTGTSAPAPENRHATRN